MASRASLMLVSAAFAVLPSALLAQGNAAAAPPEVDKALRANVTEFFQDFIDKKFRQALNLVAEDTQDKYFSSPKAEITEFNVDGIDYTGDFTRATVKMNVKVILHLKAEGFLQDTNVPKQWDTNWKIENGKWVYYEPPAPPNTWVTPMGPSNLNTLQAGPGAVSGRAINDQNMAAEAQRILQQSGFVTGVTPDHVKFTVNKPETAKLVFRNGVPGQVQVSVEGITEQIGCLASKVDQASVNAGAETTIEIIYDPTSGPTPTRPVTLGISISPFNTLLPVEVTFEDAKN